MKLIEALKQLKDLARKAEDLRNLVKQHCATSTIENPTYPDQRLKVDTWLQAHRDLLKEILRLRIAIQKTNLATMVPIELNGKTVEKSIAEWIHRRRDLAKAELDSWSMLTDRNIKEGMVQGPGGTPIEMKIIRFYDPAQRDNMKSALASEPIIIDGRLEIANAVTDLIE